MATTESLKLQHFRKTVAEQTREIDRLKNKIIADKDVITLRVKSGKKGGKFINVVGVADAAKEI